MNTEKNVINGRYAVAVEALLHIPLRFIISYRPAKTIYSSWTEDTSIPSATTEKEKNQLMKS